MNRINTNQPIIFETLSPLPFATTLVQCVAVKDEILICKSSEDYKNKKIQKICDYPLNVTTVGHCVVKRIHNNNVNNVSLLSFGGREKHTLVMRYTSVWRNNNKMKNNIAYNQWIPLTDNFKKMVKIGRDEDNYEGVRAVISGSNNHLLFISYKPRNLDVFDLNTLQYISRNTLSIDDLLGYHCFTLMIEHPPRMVINKKKNSGLSIEYNESVNTFQFRQLQIFPALASSIKYAYVCIENAILFFGGYDIGRVACSKKIYMYSIKEDKWKKLDYTLPCPLFDCVALLTEHDKFVHIIGRGNRHQPMHKKINLKKWMKEEMKRENALAIIEGEKRDIQAIKKEIAGIAEIKDGFKLKKLKVGKK
ncbi:hypothetical protein RFI_08032, partial [Reticulomyxa filosa]